MRMIHDLVDPNDPQGRSYKEVNAEKKHQYPIGSLVEIVKIDDEDDSSDIGVRLFVVSHDRDCDMTPLYSLAWNPKDTIRERKGFANHKWMNGNPEGCLKLIKE